MYPATISGTSINLGEIQRNFYSPEFIYLLQSLAYHQLCHGMARPCKRISRTLTHLSGFDIVLKKRVHTCTTIGCFSGYLLSSFYSHAFTPLCECDAAGLGLGSIQYRRYRRQTMAIGCGIEPLTFYCFSGQTCILIALNYQMRKLSPQPQRSSSLGLMNSNPSFNPLR